MLHRQRQVHVRTRPRARPVEGHGGPATHTFAEPHDLFATGTCAAGRGARVALPDQWQAARRSWLARLVDLVYGGLPPAPNGVEVTLRSQGRVRRLSGEPVVSVYGLDVDCGGASLELSMQVITPRVVSRPLAAATGAVGASGGPQRLPVVMDPDACWWNLDDTSVARFLARGVALVRFDRTEVVADPGSTPGAPPPRRGGLYDRYPDAEFGALAAWAWGIHRVVDAIGLLASGAVGAGPLAPAPLDATRVALTGFSRGGKAALLAGATDERIGLVHAHASGAGGAAPFLVAGEGSEGMRVAVTFPGWFGPRLGGFSGREAQLPVDQHALLAAVMPRPLLLTCGAEDLWANPAGTAQAALAAREVAKFLGAPAAVELRVRPGGHHHGEEDWSELLRCLANRWLAANEPSTWRDATRGLEPVFAWRAPSVSPPRPPR